MGNFNNDSFPILSVNFVLNNSIAQHLEMCLSKNTWSGSWHIYLSQLRISFMKHLKRNWKKTNNYYYCLYITIIKSKFYWSSYWSNHFSTLIFSYFQIGSYKPYNHKARVILSTLWGTYLFILKWNPLQGNISLEKNIDQNLCYFSLMEKSQEASFIQLFWGSVVCYLHTTPLPRPLQVLQT